MIKFLRGIHSAITSTAIKDEQILFDETNSQLMIDKKPSGETGTRYIVKTPLENQLDGETILIL